MSNPHSNLYDKITLIISLVALSVAICATLTTYYQGVIMSKEFEIESIPPQIPSFVANNVNLQNITYNDYPLTEKVSVSIVSTHFLKISVQKVSFANPYGPFGNFTKAPLITFRPVEKYIGNGVTNLEFDVPFRLTMNVNQLYPYPANTTWAGIPITTDLLLTDLQNKTAPDRLFTASNYLGISGQYLPKNQVTEDNTHLDESTKVTIHRSIS